VLSQNREDTRSAIGSDGNDERGRHGTERARVMPPRRNPDGPPTLSGGHGWEPERPRDSDSQREIGENGVSAHHDAPYSMAVGAVRVCVCAVRSPTNVPEAPSAELSILALQQQFARQTTDASTGTRPDQPRPEPSAVTFPPS